MLKATAENFDRDVIGSDKTVLVDFYADWCGPCRMVAPIVEEIAAEYPEILVAKVNVDDSVELAMRYGIVSIPTLIVVKNGEVTDRVVGARSKTELLSLLGLI